VVRESVVVGVAPRGAEGGAGAAAGRCVVVVACSGGGLAGWLGGRLRRLGLVEEMAPGSVGAEADGVESAAELRFVLGVAAEVSEFVVAVSKLTFISVFTGAALLERPAQLGLVAAGVDGSLALSR